MGYRLSKIYTRTGDEGHTGIAGGERLAKDNIRIHAIGEIDELNSLLGFVRACSLTAPEDALLQEIQQDLFNLGGTLAAPELELMTQARIAWLETHIDAYNATLPPLREFILPGGNQAAALCHLARTVCRRTERSMVSLNQQEPQSPVSLSYINRLSDLLFVLARSLAKQGGHTETLWQNKRIDKPVTED